MTENVSPSDTPRTIYKSLFWAALVTLIGVQENAGLLLALVVVPLLLWLIYCVFVMFRKPERRKSVLTRISIWVVAVMLIAGVQTIRESKTRDNADTVVAALRTYSTSHGHCPITLDEIGITKEQLKDRLGRAHYWCNDGGPTLIYGATFAPFDTYSYDFDKGEWIYVPD